MTVALALAIVASALLPFVPVPVDDRGEALPTQFRGLTLEVRSMLTGETVEAQNETLFSVAGPAVILSMILPLLVVGGAFWINRTREQRSRPLTIAMVLMAVVVAFGTGGGQIFYLGSLIALAVASFQVRKYELPARTAEKIAPPDDGDEVIDVDEVETDEERALAELEQELRHETDVSEGGNGAKRR
jgi:hypothetical protein